MIAGDSLLFVLYSSVKSATGFPFKPESRGRFFIIPPFRLVYVVQCEVLGFGPWAYKPLEFVAWQPAPTTSMNVKCIVSSDAGKIRNPFSF